MFPRCEKRLLLLDPLAGNEILDLRRERDLERGEEGRGKKTLDRQEEKERISDMRMRVKEEKKDNSENYLHQRHKKSVLQTQDIKNIYIFEKDIRK